MERASWIAGLVLARFVLRSLTRSLIGIAALALVVPAAASPREDLTFEERVQATESILRIYHSHQLDAKQPFEVDVPRAAIAEIVRRTIDQSLALEERWRAPITAEMLRAEWERVAANTHYPERLKTIYAPLGNDPVRIQECLIRPLLAERMAVAFLEAGEAIQGARRAEAEALRAKLESGEQSADAGDPRRHKVLLKREDSEGWFDRLRATAPGAAGRVGPMTDQGGSFLIAAVLSEDQTGARFVQWAVPKVTWDEFAKSLPAGTLHTVATPEGGMPNPDVIATLPAPRGAIA